MNLSKELEYETVELTARDVAKLLKALCVFLPTASLSQIPPKVSFSMPLCSFLVMAASVKA